MSNYFPQHPVLKHSLCCETLGFHGDENSCRGILGCHTA